MTSLVIFDDSRQERSALMQALEDLGMGSKEVVAFDGEEELKDGDSFESHVLQWTSNNFPNDDVDLVACDKELGLYQKLRGLSATPISQVALRKGFPFCLYSRQPETSEMEMHRFRRLVQWDSDEITLQGLEAADWAKQIHSLVRGFASLKEGYSKLGDQKGTPASALASMLKKPDAESRIALYGSGDQEYLKEIFVFYDHEKPNLEEMYSRMPRIFGNWLYLSILRFPGLLANEIAAASYLNISENDFAQPENRKHFESAVYRGPFSELRPWWWRMELDNLIEEAGAEDGRGFLSKKGIAVDECLDPDSEQRAGYFCMLTEKPVSYENSKGGISWFPTGADLARIRKDKFEEITSLVGRY